MTPPEPPTPPSDAATQPSMPDLLDRPAATIAARLRERSPLDALLRPPFRREVTVLLRDIQGATAYCERRGDLGGRQLVQRHNDLRCPLIAPQQGTVLNTIGDARMASVADPASAVEAAMARQRARRDDNRDQEAAAQTHSRSGRNSGPALVEPRDVFGDVVNAVARVQAWALPDQRLIAGATSRQRPPTIPGRPAGAREVQGQAAPIELCEVCWDACPGAPAPAPDLRPDVAHAGDRLSLSAVPAAPPAVPARRSLETRPHSRPRPLPRCVGREGELQEGRSSLRSARLVTRTGAGGTGNTRLALQVAPDLRAEYPDGTWCVELGGTAAPALVPRVVSSTIGLRAPPGRRLLDTLVDHLAPKATRLGLDNCEPLLEACAALADRLLRACAGLTVLATSREPRGITGEVCQRQHGCPEWVCEDIRYNRAGSPDIPECCITKSGQEPD
jgi:class 3 adenylate cyclase